jgi:two-component system sensor histidine kinase KdpD
MSVVWIGSVLTTVFSFKDPGDWFGWTISAWLWLTVVFANLAEAVAEGRGKAQADTLRKAKTDTAARRLRGDGSEEQVPGTALRIGGPVVCEAGDVIPGDGDVVEGVASVDEPAITGESAPVIREAGGDRSAVTGGTKVLSDRIVIKITTKPGETFIDRMINLVEGAARQKTPNEIALNILLASLTIVFLLAAALLGGLFPALASAVAGSLLVNWYFTQPVHTLTIADPKNIVAIAIFVGVAVSVASVVDLAARRTHQAARLRAESEILSFLAGNVLRGETSLEALLERVRETFGMESAALLERESDVAPWTCASSVGPRPCATPDDADVDVPVGDHMALALSGRVLPAEDRRVLAAFAAQAAVVLDRQCLQQKADEAKEPAEGNRIRTALLAAVSHDPRTPLAGIKASVTSLRSDDVEWSEEDQAELLEVIEEGADRLDHLVGNLLDMSRLQTGTVTPIIRETDLDEVIPMALDGVPEDSVELDIPETLPMVDVDRGLLERSVANVVENAVKYSPPGEPVLVSASAIADRVEVRVVDRGPGVPDEAKGRIFEPFQRYGDAPRGNGVGLGLAVARGFAEAIGGTLTVEDTPGGGLTMVLSLPRAASHPPPSEPDLSATVTS